MSNKPYDKSLLGVGGKAGKWQERTRLESPDVTGGRVDVAPDKMVGGKMVGPIVLLTVESKQRHPDPLLPGSTTSLVFSAPLPWCAISLSVPEELCRRFWLTSVRCAMMEYVMDEGIPCSILSDATCAACRKAKVAEELGCEWPMVMPGTNLVVGVKHVGDVPSHFQMTFEAIRGNFFPADPLNRI